MSLAVAAAVGLLAALAAIAVRRVRELRDDVRELGEHLRELSTRLETTQQDATNALARSELAECVLLEKGVADEDDLEAARERSGVATSGYVPGRDGDLH